MGRLKLCPDMNKQLKGRGIGKMCPSSTRHSANTCVWVCAAIQPFSSPPEKHFLSCFKMDHSRWLIKIQVSNLLVCEQVRIWRRENMGREEKWNPREGFYPPRDSFCMAGTSPMAPRQRPDRTWTWLIQSDGVQRLSAKMGNILIFILIKCWSGDVLDILD